MARSTMLLVLVAALLCLSGATARDRELLTCTVTANATGVVVNSGDIQSLYLEDILDPLVKPFCEDPDATVPAEVIATQQAAITAVASAMANATASFSAILTLSAGCSVPRSYAKVKGDLQAKAVATAVAESYSEAMVSILGQNAYDKVKVEIQASANAFVQECMTAYATVNSGWLVCSPMPGCGSVTTCRNVRCAVDPMNKTATAIANAVAKTVANATAIVKNHIAVCSPQGIADWLCTGDEDLCSAECAPNCCIPVANLEPEGPFCVPTTEVTNPGPVDLYILADATGSMGPYIAEVKAQATAIASAINTAVSPSIATFGAGWYRDITDIPKRNILLQPQTTNIAAFQSAINSLAASGGEDFPEGQIPALYDIATTAAVGFRPTAQKVVVMFGDAPGHTPRDGRTEAEAIAALTSAGIKVIVISVGGDGMNAACGPGDCTAGQGSRIATLTGGLYASGVSTSALVEQIKTAVITTINEEVTLTAYPGTCTDPAFDLSFASPSVTVPSGSDACFLPKLNAQCPHELEANCTFNVKDASGLVVKTFAAHYVPDTVTIDAVVMP